MIRLSSAEVLPEAADGRYILISLVVAYLLSLVPLNSPLLLVRPDFMLLALIYWTLRDPRRVGQGSAFLAGLMADVADSSVLGLHALAFSVAIFMVLKWRLRIVSFPLWPQALHLLPILLVSQGITGIAEIAVGGSFPGWVWLLGSLVGTALWPAICLLLEFPGSRSATAESP